MRPADPTEKLLKKLRYKASADAHNRVLNKVLQALDNKEKQRSAEVQPGIGRIIMKSSLTKIAIAAVIIIACVIGLSLWRTTGSGIALADVLARMEQVKAVKNKQTLKIFSEDPNNPWSVEVRSTVLKSQEYGSKRVDEETDPNGEERPSSAMYGCPQKNKPAIWIDYKNKKYIRDVHLKFGQEQYEQSQKQLGYVKGDPLSHLKAVLNTKYESLGRSTIDGIEVTGFRHTDPNWSELGPKNQPQADFKLWVDVKTLLPVRIESLSSDIFPPQRTRTFMSIVTYDFQWDNAVDVSEFEPPPIPDGYKIGDKFPEPANEETAVQGLKQSVELLGKYPERIDLSYLWSEAEKSETPAAKRLREELKGLKGFDRDERKMDALKPMRLLNKFYRGPASNHAAYYGKTVTPKDADKVLMLWKVPEKNEYRVIYGDLRAETVTAERLAELEVALPKGLTEETAIEGLKQSVELLGKYPDPYMIADFEVVPRSVFEKSETPAALKLKEELKGLTENEIVTKLLDFLMPVRGFASFYRLLVDDKKDPEYYGPFVTPKDADKVLMRWKVSDNEYRVIFGDLHAETVTAEKLTELEKLISK